MAEPRTLRHLVLVGLMGTGKTTTGRLLAERLGWPMRDSDQAIEAAMGQSVRELRDAIGTDAMHDLEAAALLREIAAQEPSVVCAAASTVDRQDCRDALRGEGIAVVWLTADPAVALPRLPPGATSCGLTDRRAGPHAAAGRARLAPSAVPS